jgi:hypothetical protein
MESEEELRGGGGVAIKVDGAGQSRRAGYHILLTLFPGEKLP